MSPRSAANRGRRGDTATSTATPDNAVPPHIAILRIESGLYFANADAVRAQITRAAGADAITAVVIDAETIPFIDVTAARMLAGLDQDLGGHRQRGSHRARVMVGSEHPARLS